MNATDFIITQLQSLTKEFKKAKVRYEYDIEAEVHTVEVLPQAVYDSHDFLEWESRVFDEFVSAYPQEILGFISEDALVGINHADYTAEGIEYAPYNTEDVQCVSGVTDSAVEVISFNLHVSPSTISFNNEEDEHVFEQTVVSDSDFIINHKLAA